MKGVGDHRPASSLGLTLLGGAVGKLLPPDVHDALTGLDSVQHHVVLADNRSHFDRTLPGGQLFPALPSATNTKNCPLIRRTAVTGTTRPLLSLPKSTRARTYCSERQPHRPDYDTCPFTSTDWV